MQRFPNSNLPTSLPGGSKEGKWLNDPGLEPNHALNLFHTDHLCRPLPEINDPNAFRNLQPNGFYAYPRLPHEPEWPRAGVKIMPRGDFEGISMESRTVPPVLFSVKGRAGVTLYDLWHPKEIEVDNRLEMVWRNYDCSMTEIRGSWYGTKYATPREITTTVVINDSRIISLKRVDVLRMVGNELWKIRELFLQRKIEQNKMSGGDTIWDLCLLNRHHIILLGITFHKNHWLPILAHDASCTSNGADEKCMPTV